MSQLITALFNVVAVSLHWDLSGELDFPKTAFTLIFDLILSLENYRNVVLVSKCSLTPP